MGISFNAGEIYQVGVEIERNGMAFYTAAAKAAADEEAKRLFEELAEWEHGHVELFERLMAQLPAGAGGKIEDVDEQQHLYLKAAADSHVFMSGADADGMVKGCGDVVAVLRLALGFEKDSVVVYTSMKALVPEKFGKGSIDRLIAEEVQHVAMIQGKIAALIG